MTGPRNRHCANCISALSFPIVNKEIFSIFTEPIKVNKMQHVSIWSTYFTQICTHQALVLTECDCSWKLGE